MEMQRRLKEAVKDLAAEIVTFGASSDPAWRPAIARIHAMLAVAAAIALATSEAVQFAEHRRPKTSAT
jgi:hypothetical protein